jgi:hypothetical protein
MQRTRRRKQKIDQTKSKKALITEEHAGIAAELQMAQEVEAKIGRKSAKIIAERKFSWASL